MSAKTVGIVGAGPIGLAAAAFLTRQGCGVAIWSPRRSPSGRAGNRPTPIRARGAIDATVTVELADRPDDLAGCDTVLTAIPATAYADVLPRVAALARPGQHVIVGGALSFAALWLHEALAERREDVLVSAWGTTLTTSHVAPDGAVEIGTLRGTFPMAAVPAARTPEAVSRARQVFSRDFEPAASVLEITLSNINPVAHAGQVLANLSRIERGEAWQLFACFTPMATRIAECIDAERLRTAAAFGVSVRSLAEHYRRSYHVDGRDVAEIVAAIEAAGRGVLGPAQPRHRYVLEDVPFGLVVYEALARIAGLAAPATSAAVTLLSAAYDRDFRQENRLFARLFPPATTLPELKARCR